MGFFDDITPLTTIQEGRVEALAKVTGKAKYAAEYDVENICYAVLVGATIPAGRITNINTNLAKKADGVIDVVWQMNKPDVPNYNTDEQIKAARFGLPIFHTNKVYFKGQPIAMVIAESLEEATYAATLIEIDYATEAFAVDFDSAKENVPLTETGKQRGSNPEEVKAAFEVDAQYNIAPEVHNPMEMHATIAHWIAADRLVLYDKNQGVMSVQRTFANLFNLPQNNVKVISEYVGGGFGSGLKVWPHAFAAVMAAKHVDRPVKLMLSRPQMFTAVGYRPASWQRVKLGADQTGKFVSILHQAKNGAAIYDPFNDGITRVTRLIYDCDNLKTEMATVPLNLSAPTWMRGPGDCTGDFAIESAIDELSYKLAVDPVQLRYKNLALKANPDSKLPWSSNYIKEAIEKGAEIIDWQKRPQKPGTLTEGNWQIGYGMAVGMWHAGRGKASAAIVLSPNGKAIVKAAMTDIGTGTGTAMQNVLHEATSIAKQDIQVQLGNSDLPPTGNQGGSTGLVSISSAVIAAADALKIKLATLAAAVSNKYQNFDATDIEFVAEGIAIKDKANSTLTYKQILDKHRLTELTVEASSAPGEERQKYAFCCASAHFCKVRVNSLTGKVIIERMVSVVDGGTIVNPKPAANQITGAAIGGIGMALMEEMVVDKHLGALVGNDLAGYHFPVNADAPLIEVAFINKPDPHINANGAKGIGEVGIIGVPPAITNAIYNATGKRFRNLPVTPDKILAGK